MNSVKRHLKKTTMAALAAAAAMATPIVRGAQQGDAVTISWSGSTFMRSFTTSRGISLLEPGKTITLNSGPGGAAVTYSAQNNNDTVVQLAAQNLGGTITAAPNPGDPAVNTANYYAIRFEWHEQGSIEGINEMVNDQIGLVNSVSILNRNGNSGNPLWINSNPFGSNNVNVVPAPPPFGSAIAADVTSEVTVNGHKVRASTYNTAFGVVYNDSNAARPGTNTQTGQNRVQQAVSDVNARQGFARPGTPSYMRIPSSAGYGLGNPALPIAAGGTDIQGVGSSGVRHQFNVASIINMPTAQVDPTTGSSYASGPWNTAQDDNLDNRTVAVGALAYVANPGTGLTRLDRTDNTWLHTTGRLQSGADFNVVTRDAYSGTLNTAAANIGLDPSWVVGENDNGNTNDTATGLAQTRIGPTIKFSGKTSGGSGVRPTIQNSRMSFGHLSSADAIGLSSPSSRINSSRPIRTLDYRDDADDVSNASNNSLPADLRNNAAYADPITGTDTTKDIYNGFTRVSAKSIVEGSYAARTNQTYVTIKAPRPDLLATFVAANPGATDQQKADWWKGLRDSDTGIKGDNSGHDVQDFRDNVLGSVVQFPTLSVGNPADTLLNLGYMLPQLAKKSKDFDGLNRDVANVNYDAGLSSQFLASSTLTAPFNADDPALIKQGSGSTYGNNNIGNGSAVPVGGSIPITANNWLFGDFDQTGSKKEIRDFSDLAVAQQAQAALAASGLGTDWNVNAGSNSSTVAGAPSQLQFTPTKGDLIVLGDFNSDGVFDGKDLYLMARGTSLADNTSSTSLTTASGADFGDMVRHGVLRKNAALDQLASTATLQQKIDASANLVNDPNGNNAFNKRDVNRDGLVNFADAVTSDKFFSKDYRNLDDQLAATGDVHTGETPTPFSLVDAELNDTGNIDQADLDVINTALVGTGNETWTGTLLKTGGGSISMAYTAAGTFKVNTAATLRIDAGTVSVGGSVDPFTDNSGTGTNGNHVAIINNSTTSLNITAGTKAIATLTGVGNTTVSAAATLSADSVQQNGLTVNGNLNIRGHNQLNTTNTLQIASSTGKMDLSDNKLIVHTTPTGAWNGSAYDGVQGMVQLGRNNGTWDGHGLVTSATDAGPTRNLTTLAVAQASDAGYGGTKTFGGQSVSGSDTLVMYTYAGDANLSGKIDGDDYFKIDAGYLASATGYLNGDFDYNGKINADDYFLIDRNYSQQGAAFLPGALPPGGLSGGVTAVPEPGSAAFILTVLGPSLASMSRRRRR